MYVCLCVCMFQHNSGTNGVLSTKLGTNMTIYYIYKYYIIYYFIYTCIYKWTSVCLWVCMFQHNSGTPGAISTKLGTHMTTIYNTYTNIILYIIHKIDVCVFVSTYFPAWLWNAWSNFNQTWYAYDYIHI
jgi:hypothetical protein